MNTTLLIPISLSSTTAIDGPSRERSRIYPKDDNGNRNQFISSITTFTNEQNVCRSFSSSTTSSSATQSILYERIISTESIQEYNENNDKDSLVEIRLHDDQKGWGLFATEDIPKGRCVFRGTALEVLKHNDDDSQDDNNDNFRDSHTVQTDWDTHVVMDIPAILVNHSCHANVGIRPNNVGAYDFIALTPIKKGQEILWDYETSEYDIASQFTCCCGSSNCRGVLSGYKNHGPIVKELYGEDYIAPYLLRGERRQQ